MTTAGGSSFEYGDRFDDLVKKLLREHPETARWRPLLSEFASVSGARDDDLEEYLGQDTFVPCLGVARVSTQPVATDTTALIDFDTEVFASTSLLAWDGGTGVVVQEPGIISITANAIFQSNAAGIRFTDLAINNGAPIAFDRRISPGTVDCGIVLARIIAVIGGDVVNLRVSHNAGVSLDITATLEVAWLGPVG